MDGRNHPSATRLSIGELTAHCPHCDATHFVPTDGPLHLQCAACHAQVPRIALLDQIAQKAIERTNEILRLARSRGRRG